MFENRVLRRIFGHKKDEVTGNGESYIMGSLMICTLTQYCSGDQSKKNEMAGACSTYGESRVVYGVLVRKPEGKRPLGRCRRRWDDNIEMALQEVVCGGMDWMDLAQYRDRWRALVNAVMNLRVR